MRFYNQNNYNTPKNRQNALNKWNNLLLPPIRKTQTNTSKTNNSTTAIAGNWIEAVGTVVTAIGSTPSAFFTEQTLTDFNIIGNLLEAGGSAIAASAEGTLLNNAGDQLQAIGNLTVVAGILEKNAQSSQLLQTQGNLLQVVGVGITINTTGKLTLLQTIANTGNIIQLIGNVMQVFTNTDTTEGVMVNTTGAWIQAVGAIITALASE